MREFKQGTFYVSIDALFDTRLAALMIMDPGLVDKAIQNDYHGRIVDQFSFVDNDELKGRLLSGDKAILKQAIVTPVLKLISRFIRQSLNSVVSSPIPIQPVVELNTFPYLLSSEEIEEMVLGLRAVTQNLADIKVVYIPIEELTPEYVKNNYIQMAMYSYWDWLNVHFEKRNFDKHTCAGVVLHAPAILKDQEAKRIFQNTDIFNTLEGYFSPFIKLNLVDVSYFCVDLKRVALKAKKEESEKTE